MNSASEEEAERLMAEAFDALDEHDLRRALKLGHKLKKMRHSSAFEIIALAYAAEDKLDDAIEILEEGVQKAPQVWLLWQLLGNYYSDRGSYGKSLECYRRALECPQVDVDSIHLNTAITLGREGKYEQALAEMQQATAKEIERRAKSQTMYLLNCTGRYAECIALGEEAIASADRGDEGDGDLASMHARLAQAVWKLRQDRGAALDYAWRAIALDKSEETAAWVIRDAANELSPSSRYLSILVCGRWPEPFEGETEAPGFFASYQVVAETPEEAMTFIRRFEPEDVRETLIIEECEEGESAPDQPKGVYEAPRGYSFFPWEEKV